MEMEERRKRYAVTLDVYVYAKNDYMARKRAHKLKGAFDKHDRRPNITEIGEQPFASMTYRKIEDISEPIVKVKDEPLKSQRCFNEKLVKPKDNISKIIKYENG